MSHHLEEYGGDPHGAEVRQNSENLARAGEGSGAAYANDDRYMRQSGQQAADPNDQWQYTGLDRALYVEPVFNEDDKQVGEQFNQMWMRDHWNGRQGLGGGNDLMQARGSLGGGIGADLLRAERGHVFQDRLSPAPAAAGQAAGAPRAKKRGFFKKLWSAIRGRGWR